MIGRLLNAQGIAGLALAAGLAVLLLLAKGDARHWRAQSGHYQQLYSAEQSAFARTVAGYRAAADQARRDDAANAARIEARQSAINERTAYDYQARIASARAAAGRMRLDAPAASDSGGGGKPAMPGMAAAPGGVAEAAGQDRLPAADALTATEQAIQLDELIKWVAAQARIDRVSSRASPAR